MELLCLVGLLVFVLIIWPALAASSEASDTEEDIEALERLRRK